MLNRLKQGTYPNFRTFGFTAGCVGMYLLLNVDLIPAHIDLVAIEIELVDKENHEYMLKQAVASIKNEYDYIIIDCAPSLGLLTLNALTAARSVVIPIQCEYFALEGLGKLLNTIKSVQKIHNPNLDIEGLLLTMYDSRLRLSNQVVDEVQKHFHDMVFETGIQRNVKLSEAPSFGLHIITLCMKSKTSNNSGLNIMLFQLKWQAVKRTKQWGVVYRRC